MMSTILGCHNIPGLQLAAHVYDKIVLAGSDYGMKHCGFYALRHLRVEKFYVFWGFDIGFTTTPIECGRDFRCDYSVG